MVRVLHISDLHFGRVDKFVETAFWTWLKSHPIDISVVSGDLTQRAKIREFKSASSFVTKLPEPRLVIPGNHDIPLYNVFRRFVSRLARYKEYISSDLRPVLKTDSLIIAGINTAHAMTIKDGKVTHSQLAHLKEVFGLEDDKIKILVTHHPLHLLQAEPDERVASRARVAIEILRECQVDVLLSGHYHKGSSGLSTVHQESGYDAILVQSGTSLSTRYRGQNNSFNVLVIEDNKIVVKRYEWIFDLKSFELADVREFTRSEGRWSAES